MSKEKNKEQDMLAIAKSCITIAEKAGAKEAAARAYRVRDVSLDYRDGNVEKISESTTRGVNLQLFVAGRYSSVSTSDLRPEALSTFITDSIAMTKAIAADPFRSLPDPELYKGQSEIDLQLEDPKYASISADDGKKLAKVAHDAARAVDGNESILSVTASFSSNLVEDWRVTSNGFSGKNRATSYFVSAQVSAKDSDGRRPEDFDYAGSRGWAGLGDAAAIGTRAAQRTLRRLGAKKGASEEMAIIVDHRATGRLLGMLNGALQGASLQQRRSFLEGRLGQELFSPLLSITDDPLIPRAFGSRKFDSEGIAAKPRVIFDKGVLKSYYLDTYYARKLKMEPTSGSLSNLSWKLGDKSQQQLIADVGEGLLITGFLGGNSNSGTGDFSVGVAGFRIREGAIAEPLSEMNLSGNHLDFWKKLVAVGNDPFPYSALRSPSVVFENVSIAGT
ncbi:MAG TPA: TldD/PmbA family protein [Thermoanaerobaculia bacterium]